jgi:hypothetical protein
MRAASLMLAFERSDRIADNLQGRISGLCFEAGFSAVHSTLRFRTIFGTLELIAAAKSEPLAA